MIQKTGIQKLKGTDLPNFKPTTNAIIVMVLGALVSYLAYIDQVGLGNTALGGLLMFISYKEG